MSKRHDPVININIFRPSPRRLQAGAALATALIFLVVITLLGVAAMRTGRIDLKLALNEESRVTAVQNADSLLSDILNERNNLTVFVGSNFVQSCYISSELDASALSSLQNFDCPSDPVGGETILTDTRLRDHAYVQIRRESVGSSDFAPVSLFRLGDSGTQFRLASFTIIAGYDDTSASRAPALNDDSNYGAAEILTGTYVKVDTIDGLIVE